MAKAKMWFNPVSKKYINVEGLYEISEIKKNEKGSYYCFLNYGDGRGSLFCSLAEPVEGNAPTLDQADSVLDALVTFINR